MKITTALMRNLEKQVIQEEISYSKMIEILNETVSANSLSIKLLSEISDEDAVEMAKIFAGIEGDVTINRPANNTELNQEDVHFVVQIHQGEDKDKPWKTFITPKYITENYPIAMYQYLQSKGYKLPVYFPK